MFVVVGDGGGVVFALLGLGLDLFISLLIFAYFAAIYKLIAF